MSHAEAWRDVLQCVRSKETEFARVPSAAIAGAVGGRNEKILPSRERRKATSRGLQYARTSKYANCDRRIVPAAIQEEDVSSLIFEGTCKVIRSLKNNKATGREGNDKWGKSLPVLG